MVMNRREVVQRLIDARNGALVVTGLGSPSYDVHAAGDDDANYYLWGAMGGAALVGFGIAQAQPGRRVMVITGDGEQLMAMGALATIAIANPTNLDIVVLDNEHFGETGMQTSHTGRGIELAKVAWACGFPVTREPRTREDVDDMIDEMKEPAAGPRMFVVKIDAEDLPRSLPLRDAVHIKNRFRSHLGHQPC
ncbi:MAG: thiamine pyrophosphate-dependent acetolactate synthase large subunit-like protein [Candidatus Poriferisodalaceae bacterium]|jgi:thiamine pyrophosphate-dependent acetolactate synthase large subunit-like protein